ncbi:hypothetical protein [Bradyrhizobium japonicum]|uniref:hypothetical protein n=1 Tax=Bradyrhizobium japonicum TaxID=375 RepID=UPI001B8A3C5D|nr:hypothetical protein [Bradyrhizobium japonicum]MBR0975234.1 hypothetical protein [Bradyrhizobium japonicum]
MARPETTGKKISTAGGKKKAGPARKSDADDDADDDDGSYTVDEFCRRNKISLQAFYKHRADMPRGYLVGSKRLISREEDREWRTARTEAAKSQPLVTDIFHRNQKQRRAREQAAQ